MKTLLECFEKMKHLPLAKTIIVKTENDLLKLKLPYFIKASIGEHKLEKKAVLRIENLNQAKHEFNRLKKEFSHSPIVIQEQIVGIEMILGLKKDEVFEKLLLIGFGGTNAEILKDVTFLAIPASKPEIKNAIESLKLYSSLFKRQKYAITKFIELASKVSKLKFNELDLNPVILTEKQAFITDARGSF